MTFALKTFHRPPDLVRPSSGYELLTQKKNWAGNLRREHLYL